MGRTAAALASAAGHRRMAGAGAGPDTARLERRLDDGRAHRLRHPTQTGKGGVTTPGVREHPPYNAEWEAIYRTHLELRDKNRFPDTISNCGVPAGFPRLFNLPDTYEFIVRPEQVWVLTENGPNILRVYTDGRPHLADQWETYTGDSVGRWEGTRSCSRRARSKAFRQGRDPGSHGPGAERQGPRDDADPQERPQHTRGADDHRGSGVADQAVAGHETVSEAGGGYRVYDYGCAENNRNPVDPTTGKTLILGPDGKVLNK